MNIISNNSIKFSDNFNSLFIFTKSFSFGGGFGGIGMGGGFGGYGGLGEYDFNSIIHSNVYRSRYYGSNYMSPGYGSFGGFNDCFHLSCCCNGK